MLGCHWVRLGDGGGGAVSGCDGWGDGGERVGLGADVSGGELRAEAYEEPAVDDVLLAMTGWNSRRKRS